MANKDEITVSTKLNIEIADRLKEQAREQGCGVNHLIKRMVMESLNPKSDIGLADICFLYDVNEDILIKNIQWLFDSKKLYMQDGRLRWNPRHLDPEFFSLDDKVEALNVSEKEKSRIKRNIAENLEKMAKADDTGNGAGL